MSAHDRPSRGERNAAEWAWFIIAMGAVLRFQGLDWDHGLMLHPDERNIAAAAAQLEFPGSVIPTFHAYNGLSLYLPRFLAELLSASTQRSGTDMAAIIFAGRLLSAAYATLAIPVLWATARRALGTGPGLLVVGCVAASPGLIQAAHFATTESGLVLCTAVVAWLCMRHVQGELTLRRFALLSGIVIGLGFGLKTSALVLAAGPIVAVGMTTLSQGRLWAAVGSGVTAIVVVCMLGVVTTPQILFEPKAYLATLRFEAAVVSGAADVFWTYQFHDARDVLFELVQLPWLVGPLVGPLGLAGLCLLVWRLWQAEPGARALAPAAAIGVLYASIVFNWHAKFIRYLMILVPILILLAGYCASQIQGKRRRIAVMVMTGLVTVIAGLLQGAIYQRPDPRLVAWQWMAPQLGPGDTLVVEPRDLGPPYQSPSSPAAVDVLPLLEPHSPEKLEAMADILAGGTWMIVASRRHHGVLPRMRQRFPDMCGYYQALWSGRLGYDVVGTFKRRGDWPRLIDPQRRAEETFTVFDSPEVYVLVNAGAKSAPQIKAEISMPADCN